MENEGRRPGFGEEGARGRIRWREGLLLAALLLFFFATRWPFREADLIRDEGEYLHLGQEILRGRIPYLDIYNEKTPFVFYFFALVTWIAGIGIASVRVATTLYGMLTLAVLYALARRLFGGAVAFWTCLAFTVMMLTQFGIYNQATAEFFGLLWLVLALYLWQSGQGGAKVVAPLLAGVAAGIAYQTKQTGLFVLAFLLGERALGWLTADRRPGRGVAGAVRDAGLAAAGFALLQAGVLAYFFGRGALPDYVTCTWTNLFEYVGARGGVLHDPDYARQMFFWLVKHDFGLWAFGAAGLLVLAVRGRDSRARHLWLLPVLVLASAFQAGQFYTQYFQPLLVPLAIGCGLTVDWLGQRVADRSAPALRRWTAAAVALSPWVMPAALLVQQYVLMDRVAFVAQQHSVPPFHIAEEVGRYLAERTEPGEPILVVGSEPEVYYFADRPCVGRMQYTYPLAGPYTYTAAMREQFFDRWGRERPRYVVWVPLMPSLSEWPQMGKEFAGRALRELAEHYVVEQPFPRPSRSADGTRRPAHMVVLRRSDVPAPPGSEDPGPGPGALP